MLLKKLRSKQRVYFLSALTVLSPSIIELCKGSVILGHCTV